MGNHMNKKLTLLIGGAALLTAALAIASAVSYIRLTRLEQRVAETKAVAEAQQRRADELEKQTYVYKEKIEYLENRLAELGKAAARQDKELDTLAADTDAARRDLQRLRGGPNPKR